MEYKKNRSDIMENLFKAINIVADKSVKAYKQDVTIDGEINEIPTTPGKIEAFISFSVSIKLTELNVKTGPAYALI